MTLFAGLRICGVYVSKIKVYKIETRTQEDPGLCPTLTSQVALEALICPDPWP